MAVNDDSTVPLLFNQPKPTGNPTKHHHHHHPNSSPSSTLDSKIEECIGDFGYRQLIQAFLVSLAWAFDAQQCFITIFTDATTSTATTTVSEWHLDETSPSSVIRGLPSSAFFTGCVAGGLILSTLADSVLGRKNLLLLCTLTMSISSFLAAFSPNILIYSFLRFLCGFGRAPIGTCSLVLCTELVGKRRRGQVGILGFVLFSFGFLSLPGIAYLNRYSSWRDIYLWTSGPALAYCVVVHFFVHESPRWLMFRGWKEDAVRTLKSISEGHGGSFITLSFFDLSPPLILLDDNDDEEQGGCGGGEKDDDDNDGNIVINDGGDGKGSVNDNVFAAMKVLVSRKWSSRRLLAVTTISFGIGTIYFGMPLGLSNLPFNLYVSVSLNALSELPSSLIAFLLIHRMNRRVFVVAASVFSGVCSVLVAVVARNGGSVVAQVGLELASFSSGIMASNLALIHTTELFPTCVRNSALAMARQAMVMGGVFGPFLVAAGRKNPFLSYGVFGVVVMFCGLFSLSLPETRGATLCDTMDEEEKKIFEGIE